MFPLWLLPSGPDRVHGLSLRRHQWSHHNGLWGEIPQSGAHISKRVPALQWQRHFIASEPAGDAVTGTVGRQHLMGNFFAHKQRHPPCQWQYDATYLVLVFTIEG